MTREEAIKGLKVLAKDFGGYKPNEEMFDMAINALEQPEIIHCRDCKHWTQQTNYDRVPLSFGFCESDDMWRSLYGEIYEVAHIDTDEDFYCGHAKRREEGDE